MSQPPNIDGVLIQWGDRLFYPGNRVVKTKPQPKLSALAPRQRVAAIRERIEATVVRRVPTSNVCSSIALTLCTFG